MKKFSNVVNAMIVASMVLVGANFALAKSYPVDTIDFSDRVDVNGNEIEMIDYIWSGKVTEGAFSKEYAFTLSGSGSFGFELSETWKKGLQSYEELNPNSMFDYVMDISSVVLKNDGKVVAATNDSGIFNVIYGQHSVGEYAKVANWKWENLNQGDYTLALAGHVLNGNWNDGQYDLRDVTYTQGSGSTNPSEVPEPATMALLGLGLLGVAGVARKNKKN